MGLFVQLLHAFTPTTKLAAIVGATKSIADTATHHYQQLVRSLCVELIQHSCVQGQSESLGCDDLLPIVLFVIVQSGVHGLVTEIQFLVSTFTFTTFASFGADRLQEEFIDNAKLNGEDGYTLATIQARWNHFSDGLNSFQVAVEYLTTADLLSADGGVDVASDPPSS